MKKEWIIGSIVVVLITTGYIANSYINNLIETEVREGIEDSFEDLEYLFEDMDSGVYIRYDIDNIHSSYLFSTLIFEDFKFTLDDGYQVLTIRFEKFTISTDFESLYDYADELIDVTTRSSEGLISNDVINDVIYELANTISKDYFHEITDLRIKVSDTFSVKIDTFIIDSSLNEYVDPSDITFMLEEEYLYSLQASESKFVDIINDWIAILPEGESSTIIKGFSLYLSDSDVYEIFGVRNINVDSANFIFKRKNNLTQIDAETLTNFAGNYKLNFEIDEEIENIVINSVAYDLNKIFRDLYSAIPFMEKHNRDSFTFEFDGSYERFSSFILKNIN